MDNHPVAKKPGDDTSKSSTKTEGNDAMERAMHLEVIPDERPDDSPIDITPNIHSRNPQHWPKWKKQVQIWMIAIHSMISIFMAAGIIPAYEKMAEQYGVTTHEASYLTSSQILLLGIGPLIWGPVTSRYGRYPICLFSVVGSMACNIGGARCTTFGTQMTTRVLLAFLISPPIGIGGGIIAELARPDERAEKLGYWTLLTVLGTPAGPLIMGFVIKHVGVEWVYWIFAILNLVQAITYLVLGDETRYIASGSVTSPGGRTWRRFLPSRIDPTPLSIGDFVFPLTLIRYPRIIIPAVAHAVIFCYANIAIVVEMPIVYGQKFHFDAQQIGLQFIAVIIGCALGEQASGPLSDFFLKTLRKRRGRDTCPADRLWLVYTGFGTVFAGLLTWGFQLEKARTWNVTPGVGAAIASFGNQIQTTILLSFAVDSHREHATAISILTNCCRLLYGFVGPFYFPPMFSAIGLGQSAGVMCVIIACLALIPIVGVQIAALRSARRSTTPITA